jgi:DNA polymerase III epsilon subunit-like protein
VHPLSDAVKQIYPLLKDCLLVGHGIESDLRSLGIDPKSPIYKGAPAAVYNTAAIKVFQKFDGDASLKNLTSKLLGRSIQTRSHDALEDAQAVMELYMRCVQFNS